MTIELLTAKDCMYLEDLMNQTYCAIKRLEAESDFLTTDALKASHKSTIKGLKQSYKSMLSIIKEVNGE